MVKHDGGRTMLWGFYYLFFSSFNQQGQKKRVRVDKMNDAKYEIVEASSLEAANELRRR